MHKYGSRLVLRALVPEQAGTYHCKASTEAGAIRSAPAQLTVLGGWAQGLCGEGKGSRALHRSQERGMGFAGGISVRWGP